MIFDKILTNIWVFSLLRALQILLQSIILKPLKMLVKEVYLNVWLALRRVLDQISEIRFQAPEYNDFNQSIYSYLLSVFCTLLSGYGVGGWILYHKKVNKLLITKFATVNLRHPAELFWVSISWNKFWRSVIEIKNIHTALIVNGKKV